MTTTSPAQTWYVYRHALSTSVLKAPETVLEITPDLDIWKARFELSSQVLPFEVDLTAYASSGAWQNSADGDLDFRLDRIAPDLLIGQIYDRNAPTESRDSFVAVRSKRTVPLPDQSSYRFDCAQYIPFSRDEPYEPTDGGVSVDLSQNKITLDGTIYTIEKNETPPEGGRRLDGSYLSGLVHETIHIWILPLDGTAQLVATGHFMHELLIQTTAPGDPQCTRGLCFC